MYIFFEYTPHPPSMDLNTWLGFKWDMCSCFHKMTVLSRDINDPKMIWYNRILHFQIMLHIKVFFCMLTYERKIKWVPWRMTNRGTIVSPIYNTKGKAHPVFIHIKFHYTYNRIPFKSFGKPPWNFQTPRNNNVKATSKMIRFLTSPQGKITQVLL